MLGCHPPPPLREQTPLGADTPEQTPSQEQTPPWEQTTPREQIPTPPPTAEHAGRYSQRADGTLPTGMQSSVIDSSIVLNCS